MEVNEGGNVYRGRRSVRKALGGQEYPHIALVTMSKERALGRGLTTCRKTWQGDWHKLDQDCWSFMSVTWLTKSWPFWHSKSAMITMLRKYLTLRRGGGAGVCWASMWHFIDLLTSGKTDTNRQASCFKLAITVNTPGRYAHRVKGKEIQVIVLEHSLPFLLLVVLDIHCGTNTLH